MRFIQSLVLLLPIALHTASARSFRGSAAAFDDNQDSVINRILAKASDDAFELTEARPEGAKTKSIQKTAHESKSSSIPFVDNGQGFNPEVIKSEPDSDRNMPRPKDDGIVTKGIVGIDERFIFRNTSFPYRTVGRIAGDGYTCTGTVRKMSS